jgi:transposase
MPKGDNVIHFSFPARYRDRLIELSQDGESLGLCAKRLLIEYIESIEQEEKCDRLEALENRLKAIEENLLYGNGAAKRKTETKK